MQRQVLGSTYIMCSIKLLGNIPPSSKTHISYIICGKKINYILQKKKINIKNQSQKIIIRQSIYKECDSTKDNLPQIADALLF